MGDYNISLLPYTQQNSNQDKGNFWDVGGAAYSDGSDVCYSLEIPTTGYYGISTCNNDTNFDTMLEIFDPNGTTGQFSNDNCVTGPPKASSLQGIHLNRGIYYLVVDGYAGETGKYELNIRKIR